MVALSPAVLDGVRLVVRQVTDTIVPTTATPSSTVAATTTAATPADTSVNSTPGSPGGNNTGNNNSNGNSPLLFFVALGFGVVFTNLWIIVGVKYCFRYNARNRAMRVNEDGEPITLENMPRPHRRRREKKLMTMDEVNEKFPMQKYKSWVASRAQEGLPTRGGVSVPPSRANSIRSARGVATELASKERTSSEGRPTSSASVAVKTRDTSKADVTTKPEATESTSSAAVADPNADGSATSTPAPGQPIQAEPTIAQQKAARTSDDHSSEDDDEHINAALPPEFMTSGDTCAICIDSLDDDEDVRGLTCGHAFHAVCVDPWLTSRRACCPLCKADYYTPKPRPAAADGSPGTDGGATGIVTVTLPENGGRRSDRQPRTQSNWLSFRSRGRSATNGNSSSTPTQRRQPATADVDPNANSTQGGRGLLARLRPSASNGASRQTPTESNAPAPAPAPAQGQSGGGFLSNLRSPFRQHAPATNAPTPSQVEAGTAAR